MRYVQTADDSPLQLLTVRQVQQLLHIDRSTIYRMAADGRLPSIRVGRQLRFPAAEIHALVSPQEAPMRDDSGHPGGPPLDPVAATAAIEVAAKLLDVMMVVTDMSGQPVTPIVNPCPGFALAAEEEGALAQCLAEWEELASDTDLAPRFRLGPLGFECARAFVRDGSNLIGMVLIGGVEPADGAGAVTGELTRLDAAERQQALETLPVVARAIASARAGEATTTTTPLNPRPASVGA
ncbi:MAG: helix-turn-helix domain-containing protein [Actinobacteria bacterium]|nr:helix-turn-helix domain-containing protein [Actinomycetota bacterium]MCB9411624.1 helix-turn-helix domain-containing protein [Actinomycetota bacterium]